MFYTTIFMAIMMCTHIQTTSAMGQAQSPICYEIRSGEKSPEANAGQTLTFFSITDEEGNATNFKIKTYKDNLELKATHEPLTHTTMELHEISFYGGQVFSQSIDTIHATAPSSPNPKASSTTTPVSTPTPQSQARVLNGAAFLAIIQQDLMQITYRNNILPAAMPPRHIRSKSLPSNAILNLPVEKKEAPAGK